MILAIDLSKLRNAEFIQFNKNVSSLLLSNNPLALSVKPQYDAMEVKIVEMESLFKNDLSNPITAEMEVLDSRRDNSTNGIIALINAYSYHYDTTINNAAAILHNNLKVYGTGIAKENYQNETAILNNLIADWENKPELASAVTILNLDEWVSELKSVNQDFDQKYLARTQDYAAESTEKLKTKRTEAMAAYYDLRKHLEAYATVQGSPAYDKVIGELNSLIEQYNTLLRARMKPKKKTEETPS